MEIKYLQVLVMPNGEILCEGKTIGWVKDLGKYIFSEASIIGEKVDNMINKWKV